MAAKLIPVTMLLSDDDFSEFRAEAKKADIKHSILLRNLSKGWIEQQKLKDSRRCFKKECTGNTHKVRTSASTKGISGFRPRLL